MVGVELPPRTANGGDVWVALDGQTGKLDQANANGEASMAIVEGCEARDAKTVARLKAPWWQRPFLPKP